MTDLVSGNLKEEKTAHSTQPLHLAGPRHQPRNLLFQNVASRSGHAESCTFGGEEAETGVEPPSKCAVICSRKSREAASESRRDGRGARLSTG
jgi:hypothetical protein